MTTLTALAGDIGLLLPIVIFIIVVILWIASIFTNIIEKEVDGIELTLELVATSAVWLTCCAFHIVAVIVGYIAITVNVVAIWGIMSIIYLTAKEQRKKADK